MNPAQHLMAIIRPMPLIAILRGLQPTEALAMGNALYASGFRVLEVPLNRPGALECIALLAHHLPGDTLVGGGTMLTLSDVDAVHGAGGRLMVAPNCNPAVITHAVARGMVCAPGVATPSEAFSALESGAHALKIFPAEMVGHGGLKAMKSVLPAGIDLWPVGGITPESMPAWRAAGATGFGIGGNLFTPGVSADQLLVKGRSYVSVWRGEPNS